MEVIRNFVSSGEHICLILQGGKIVEGQVSDIGKGHLLISALEKSHCVFTDGIISIERASCGASIAPASAVEQSAYFSPEEDSPPTFALGEIDELCNFVSQLRLKLEVDAEDFVGSMEIVNDITTRFIHSSPDVKSDQVMRNAGMVPIFKLVEKCRERAKAREAPKDVELCSKMLLEVNRALRSGSRDMDLIEQFIDAYHFLVAAAGDSYAWENQAWISDRDWQELGTVLKQAREQWAPQIEKDARITDAWRKRPYLQSGFYKRRSLICSALAHFNWESLAGDQIEAIRRESREWAAISLRTAMPPSLEPQAAGRITSFGNGGFGFLRNSIGEDFQFRLTDVCDPEIRGKISMAQGHYDIPVDFDAAEKESAFARYRRARNIRAPGFRIFQLDSIHDQSTPGHGFMTAIVNEARDSNMEAYFSLLLLPSTLREIPSSGETFLASVNHTPDPRRRAQFTCREMREIWRADSPNTKTAQNSSLDSVSRSKELLDLARAATIEEDYQRAVKHYEDCMALKVWPDCVYRYAALLKNLEQDDEAAEVYRRGMAIWPEKYKIFEDAGVHAMSRQDYVNALTYLRRSVELAHAAPGRVGEKGALLALGRALSDIGSPDALEEAWTVYHRYFEAYGQEAFLRGRVPARDVHAWEKVKEQTREFSRQVFLSEEVLKVLAFFQNAGFKHQVSKVTEHCWTDLVFDTPADWEEVRLRQQVFVRCLSQDYHKGVDLNGIQDEVRINYPSVDQTFAFLIAAQFNHGLKENLAGRLHANRSIIDGFNLFFVDMTYDEVVESANARKTLHDRITSRIAERDAFAVSSVVLGWQFFGREALLAEVSNLVLQDQAVGIFGLRRSGKTSFLRKFEEQQRAKGNLTLRIDCQLKCTAAEICNELGKLLYEEVERSHPGTTQWSYCDKSTRQTHLDFIDGFLNDLESVVQLFRQLPREDRPRILVFLDEIDYLIETQEADAFGLIGGLRGLHQIHPESLGLIVAAPNVSLQEKDRVADRRFPNRTMDNPLYQYLVAKYLPFLNEWETAEMLKELGGLMGVRFGETVCKYIHSLTAGHPMITRCVASLVVTRFRADKPSAIEVEISHVSAAARDYMVEAGTAYHNGHPGAAEGHFQEILGRLERSHPGERKTLDVLARSTSPVLIHHMGGPHAGGYKHLIRYQLVQEKDGCLFIRMELFRQYLNQHRTES